MVTEGVEARSISERCNSEICSGVDVSVWTALADIPEILGWNETSLGIPSGCSIQYERFQGPFANCVPRVTRINVNDATPHQSDLRVLTTYRLVRFSQSLPARDPQPCLKSIQSSRISNRLLANFISALKLVISAPLL